ncbi:MAG: hypothetical protein JW818_13450 [Pirellulales bacterium]|nr:hypothetical protein [Pirellulales bacterium]
MLLALGVPLVWLLRRRSGLPNCWFSVSQLVTFIMDNLGTL